MWWLKLLLAVSLVLETAFAKVYEIAEPDMLSEIESKKFEAVKKIARETQKAEKQVYSLKGVNLPPAKKNYTYYVDPTVVLQADIPKVNREGKIVGILYRKGTKINPLEYLSVKPPPMIVFNACDDRQVFLVKKIIKEKKLFSYILVSGGCSIKQIRDKKVYENLKSRIYILTDELVRKLKLKNTISLVEVDGNRIKVEVYKKDIN